MSTDETQIYGLRGRRLTKNSHLWLSLSICSQVDKKPSLKELSV